MPLEIEGRITAAAFGELDQYMREEVEAARRAVEIGVTRAAVGLKQDWRDELRRAGLGDKLPNAIRERIYPNDGIDAAGVVRATGAAGAIIAHTRGAVITAKEADALAIPTEAAGKGPGGRRITPELWEQKTGLELRPIFRPGRAPLLVATLRARTGRHAGRFAKPSRTALRTGRGLADAILFVLQTIVRLPKRTSGWGRYVTKWQDTLPELVVDAWDDEAERRHRRRDR
jgi:hypothetical protein